MQHMLAGSYRKVRRLVLVCSQDGRHFQELGVSLLARKNSIACLNFPYFIFNPSGKGNRLQHGVMTNMRVDATMNVTACNPTVPPNISGLLWHKDFSAEG
jgi:hypothetical protein